MEKYKIFYFIFLFLLILASSKFIVKNIEKNTLFQPSKVLEKYPDSLNLNYEDLYFYSDGVPLNAWFIKNEKAKYTIFFCHGNAGNISGRIDKARFFYDLNCNFFIFDYRGFGKSKGKATENNLYKDADSAYNFLLSKNISPETIIGYGESLGSAVVIDLASRRKLKAIIIEGGFSSGKDMAKYIYPYIPFFLSSVKLNSEDKIKSLKFPKLFIHSTEDSVVPYEFGLKLYNSAPKPKEFLKVTGTHGKCFIQSKDLVYEKISKFLDSLNSDIISE